MPHPGIMMGLGIALYALSLLQGAAVVCTAAPGSVVPEKLRGQVLVDDGQDCVLHHESYCKLPAIFSGQFSLLVFHVHEHLC